MMKAVVIKEYSEDPKSLQQIEIPKPEPEPRDLRVKVHAVALNPADYRLRSNLGDVSVKLEKPRVLGWDASGVVESVGKDVKNFKVGDEVMFAGCINRAGCNSEYCLVDERITGRKPKNLTFEHAASIPLTGLTAWQGLEEMGFEDGKTYPDKTILVFGGAGGMASMVILLAKKLFGLKVIGTGSRKESEEAAKKFGADFVIDHKKDLQEELKRVGFDGVDNIYNCYKDDEATFSRFVPIINPEGKICLINALDTALNLGGLFFKKVTIVLEFMVARPILGVNMERQGEMLNRFAELVEKGQLDVSARVSKHFPSMSHLPEAHALLASQHTIGKIVVTAKFDEHPERIGKESL